MILDMIGKGTVYERSILFKAFIYKAIIYIIIIYIYGLIKFSDVFIILPLSLVRILLVCAYPYIKILIEGDSREALKKGKDTK